MKYELTLVNEKLSLYNRISWIVVIIHCLIFLYLGIYSDPYRKNAIGSLVLVALILVLNYFLKNKTWFKKFDLMFLIFGLTWISIELYWLAIIPGVFYLFHGLATINKNVVVSDPGIYYPSFPPRNFQWQDISNVILKDGLFTIDRKNNRLIQQMITADTVVNEKEFNDFCKKKLMERKEPVL